MTPDEYTIQETFVEVSDDHTLYVHDWGNKDAKVPIIFLHGGPGSHTKDSHKHRFFDPKKQRVLFFDQRGAGKSLPYGSLENNTTDKLVHDIVTLADHFGYKKFIVVGGSWGSTLALSFAVAHPERVSAMVLNGVFTGTTEEIAWLDQGRFKTFFPDVWERYLAATPKSYHDDPSAYHFNRILKGSEEESKTSAFAYSNLEGSVATLDDHHNPENFDEFDPVPMRIEVQYMANRCFMPEGYLHQNAHKLTMPVWLMQGRYDMVCPPQTAYKLSQALPNSELVWTVSGHSQERESWNIIRTILRQLTS